MYWNVPRIVPCAVSRAPAVGTHRGVADRAAAGQCLRQAEVEQLRTGLRQHHVARLEIAMDDAVPVRAVERVGDLDAVSQNLVEDQTT